MKIAFLGDIAFLGQFDKSKNSSAEKKLSFLKKELERFDYVVANLESPLTDRERTLVCKSMHLKAAPCNVDLLKYLNISAVSLANNHIADYGRKGLNDTIQILEKAGIGWFGIGNKSLELFIKGEKVNISGYCCYSSNGTHYGGKTGVNLLTLDELENQLKKDEANGAFSVMAVHWGMEHTNYPAYEHIKLAHNLLEKHTAVICGHHPHIVQGIERINTSIIAYSLGNAIFDTCVSKNGRLKVELNEDNRKGIIFGVDVEKGKIIDYEVSGFYIGNTGIEKWNMNEHISMISEKLTQIDDAEQYEAMRMSQFQKVIESKFGKHDLKWLMSRMNYYAVGARILGTIRAQKYKKEAERFING